MAVAEKRTQVYFPEKLYKRLKKRAKKEGKSVAAIIREASEEYLKEEKREIDWENDPIFKLAGLIETEEGDLSVNHDHYLYGTPKKKVKE